MKIAYFINIYPKVSHSFIRREILALERQGFEIQRIALHGWLDPLPDLEDQRERERTRYVLRRGPLYLLLPTLLTLATSPFKFLSALRLAWKMAGRVQGRPFPYHMVYLAEACTILPWLRQSGATHVHAHFGINSAEVMMLLRALGGPPFSFTIHGPDEFVRDVGLDEKVHLASFVVGISSYGRSQLFLQIPRSDWPKVKIVHCGLEPEFYASAAVSKPPGLTLVCVGRLAPAKGQILLLDAAARLAAKGIAFELVLAGDGEMRGELEGLISKYGLQNNVRITGWISSSEVRREILGARALVLPSFAEGLPVVLMEAMALRRPVITTYIAGIPELVRDKENGWLIPAGSLDDLATAMEDCLSRSDEEINRIGAAGYERVVSRHCIDVEAAKLAEHFRAAAG